MTRYEYTVIPAPARGDKSKGAKTGIERFAAALADILNEMGVEGWDYVRAETLPSEERSGLTGRTTVYHNVLVFRRAVADEKTRAPVPEQSGTEPVPAPLRPASAPDAAPAPNAEAPTSDAPVRPPFSQPMRAMPRPLPARPVEPPLTAPEPVAISGPRLGPASR